MAGFIESITSLLKPKEQVPVEDTTAMKKIAEDAVLRANMKEVAMVLAAEAAGEGEEGMLGVAHVINNRAKQSGKSIHDVISAKNQFYGYTAKNKEKLYNQVKDVADKIAEQLYNNQLGDDFTKGATFFRQPKEPIYSWHGDETVKIGNHIFHREKRR